MTTAQTVDAAVARLAEALLDRGLTVSAAERCTGGLVGKLLTDRPGSSDFFRGAIVAYHNDIKHDQLGVDADDLSTKGAVSEPVARQMAQGAARALGADVGLGVTGVAGPGGGTSTKPVGLVWMAVALPGGRVVSNAVRFDGDRDMVRNSSALTVIEMATAALTEDAV